MKNFVHFIIVIGKEDIILWHWVDLLININIFFDPGMLYEACSSDGESIQILGGNGDMTLSKDDYELGMICQWTIEAPENMVRIILYLFLCWIINLKPKRQMTKIRQSFEPKRVDVKLSRQYQVSSSVACKTSIYFMLYPF